MRDKEKNLDQEMTEETVSELEQWSPEKITRRKRFVKDVRVNWQLYLMVVVPVAYYILFRYVPMFGNILAFRKYQSGGSIFGTGAPSFKYFGQFITSKPFLAGIFKYIDLERSVSDFQIPAYSSFRVALKRDQKPSLEEVRTDSFLSPALYLNGYRLRHDQGALVNFRSYQCAYRKLGRRKDPVHLTGSMVQIDFRSIRCMAELRLGYNTLPRSNVRHQSLTL